MMNVNIDEKEWVVRMSNSLNSGHIIDIQNPVSIFQVSNLIKDTTPEAYTPQVVGLGPYHHFRPRTYFMQNFKLTAAIRARELLKLREFQEMMHSISDKLPDIRASYQDNLGFENETLGWMMLIDGLFLLSLMRCSPKSVLVQEKNLQVEVSKGRKHSLNTIVKDTVLLENQIPIIVLEVLVNVKCEHDGMLRSGEEERMWCNLTEFCTGLSPIELKGDFTRYAMQNPHHLLDFLQQLVWLGKQTTDPFFSGSGVTDTPPVLAENGVRTWRNLYSLLSKLNFGFVPVVLAMVDTILKVLDALGISIPRDIFSEKEVLTPRASELSGVGVKFCRIEREGGGIKEIAFKQETELVTLSLPALNMNINSDMLEVVMRNILAYEAEAMPESPKFTRYIELMAGLMQNIADVDLLKMADTNIVPRDADSEEVVKLFGSLKEAVESKGKSELDDTIEKVNAYYNNSRKVKIRRLVKRYLFVSWKVLTGIALILVLILLLLQDICSIFGCPNIFKSQYLAHFGL